MALGARLALAQPATAVTGQAVPAPSAPPAPPASSGPFVVTIPLPRPSATAAGPSPTAVGPSATVAPPVLVAPPGVTAGQAPPGYMVLVPWVPPAKAAAAPTPVAEPAAKTVDYSWMPILTDVSALGLVVVGAGSDKAAISGLGVVTYALGAPIVHWANGNVGRGFLSLGLRTLAPVGGLAVGAAVGCSSSHGDDGLGECIVGITLGSLVGFVGGLVVDYVVPSTRTVTETRTVRWTPTLLPSKNGASLGLVGAW